METKGIVGAGTRMRRVAVTAYIVLMLTGGFLYGQIIVSSIVGRVADPSGLSVSGASVTVTNTETGIVVKTIATDDGTYSVPGLLSGLYQVTATREGFETRAVSGIQVPSSSTVRVDLVLNVGSVKQEVTVVGHAPLIRTDTMTMGGSVTNMQLTDLPASLQTIDAFLQLAPGVQPFGADPTVGSINPNIGGGSHWGAASFTLNGVEVNDPGAAGAVTVQGAGGGSLVLPPPSALQELSVQSGDMTAQYRANSTVTLVTKGGTNRYHGELYEFLQNTDLNANNFILNATGKPRGPTHLNQYGGNIGGPIKRDKAFFFFDYSGYRHASSSPVQLNFPTAAMRSGNFSALCASFGANGICTGNTQLYNPFTGAAFAGNQIPSTMLATQSNALLSYLPLPTAANSLGLPNEVSNYVASISANSRLGAWDLRSDYNLSTKDRFFGVYAQRIANPWGVIESDPPTYGQSLNGYVERSVTLSETHTFGGATTNELRAAWGDYSTQFSGQNPGFTGNSLWPQMPDSLYHGLPQITASGYTGLWYDLGTAPYTSRKDVEIADDFTHVKGRHTIQAGIDETGYKLWHRTPSGTTLTGAFGFNGEWTGNRGWPNLLHSPGNALADFLLGVAQSSQTPVTGVYALWMFSRDWGMYVQDTWQATPRLTFIYGLRYEYQSPWQYRTPTITSIDLVNNKLVLPENSATPTLPPGALANLFAAYPYETTQSIGQPLQLYQGDKNNFAPRIGFAYRPFKDERTVIRGGYGVYYNFQPALVGSGNDAFNPPWQLGVTQTFTSLLPGTPQSAFMPDITFTNPFPGVNGQSTVSPNPNLNFFQWNFKMAVAQQWNLTLEHQFAANWAVRASYIGSQTHHLPYNGYNMNIPATQQPNVATQKQRPWQPWGTIAATLSAGKENFDQLQLGVNKRFAHGLSWQAEYQFTRGLDNIATAGGPNNPSSFNADYGNSTGVRRHWLVFNYDYALPIGRGRYWLRNANGWANAVVGGWQVSGISTYGTGVPLILSFSQTGTGIVGWQGGRPDRISGVPLYAARPTGHNITQGVQWFNAAAFAPPAKWTYGNAGRDIVFGPGFWNWDISAKKSFAVREHVQLQFRGDFLDAFNHLNLAGPDNTIADTRDGGTADPNSGKVTSGLYNRIVQVGVQLLF